MIIPFENVTIYISKSSSDDPTTRHLIASIQQVDGAVRKLYAATQSCANYWTNEIRNDPSMIDAIPRSEIVHIVDVYPKALYPNNHVSF